MVTMNEALLITSTLGTSRPTYAITHENAYANSSSNPNPAAASSTDELIPHPTTSPVSAMISSDSALYTTSLTVRPTSSALRDIGSARKRLMMPFWMSSARPAPVKVAPNTTVWAKIPAIRNSR